MFIVCNAFFQISNSKAELTITFYIYCMIFICFSCLPACFVLYARISIMVNDQDQQIY